MLRLILTCFVPRLGAGRNRGPLTSPFDDAARMLVGTTDDLLALSPFHRLVPRPRRKTCHSTQRPEKNDGMVLSTGKPVHGIARLWPLAHRRTSAGSSFLGLSAGTDPTEVEEVEALLAAVDTDTRDFALRLSSRFGRSCDGVCRHASPREPQCREPHGCALPTGRLSWSKWPYLESS